MDNLLNRTVTVLLLAFLCACQNPEKSTSVFENKIETVKTESNQSSLQSSDHGELIYIPIYSSIYQQDQKRTIDLSATLSIHNTDPDHLIQVRRIDYHDTKGLLLRRYAHEEIELQPLETFNLVIEEKDRAGGTGANFLVEWVSTASVSSPIVEAVMITTRMGQGISFTTNGRVIRRYPR